MTREIDVPYSVVAAPELTQLLIPSRPSPFLKGRPKISISPSPVRRKS